MTSLVELNIGGQVLIRLIVAVIGILIGGTVLHWATILAKVKKTLTKWKTAFTVVAIQAAVVFIFGLFSAFAAASGSAFSGFLSVVGTILGLGVFLLLIKNFYDLKWGKTFIVALTVWVIELVAMFLLVLLFVAMLAAVFLTVA